MSSNLSLTELIKLLQKRADEIEAIHGGASKDAEEIRKRDDLIEPNAKKPIKLEQWITLYPKDGGLEGYRFGGHYDTLEEAKKNWCPGCIAIVKGVLEGMEGYGLD